MESVQIESADVIRLILQFLKENNLTNAFQTLQQESGVMYNTLDDKASFTQAIKSGQWDIVLKQVSQLSLHVRKRVDLYTQIILELAQLGEKTAARAVLRDTDAMHWLKENIPEKYIFLETILSKSTFDEKEAYGGGPSKLKRRELLAESLSSEVISVEGSRLLSLLGQSIKYQHAQGLIPINSTFDLFKGELPGAQKQEDSVPSFMYQTITFEKNARPEITCFSKNGKYLLSGTLDGFIEVWNFTTGKLERSLEYQQKDHIMMDESAILCLSFANDAETFVSGSKKGQLKVWNFNTGACLRKIPNAHTQGVSKARFNKQGTHILSSSFDSTIRVHGIKSGKLLKEYRGHTSFVNDAVYSVDETKLMSASSDGSVKIWDAKSTECLSTIWLKDGKSVPVGTSTPSVHSVLQVPGNSNHFIVSNKSPLVYIISAQGKVVKVLKSSEKTLSDYTAMTLSERGELLYGLCENGRMSCFNIETALCEATVHLSDTELLGFSRHPFSNIFATHDDRGKVNLWKS